MKTALTTGQVLHGLQRKRTEEVIVTTMGSVRPWGKLSHSDLDFASADSAMGHAADFALGIALAQPSRRVVCVNGDGSMLMCLGTLATAVHAGAQNFVLFVMVNGTYEITGNQPIPGAAALDYRGLAIAAGFPQAFECRNPEDVDSVVALSLSRTGPVFACFFVTPGNEGPISRSEREEARYLQTSLAESAHALRRSLNPPAQEVRL